MQMMEEKHDKLIHFIWKTSSILRFLFYSYHGKGSIAVTVKSVNIETDRNIFPVIVNYCWSFQTNNMTISIVLSKM